MRTFLLLLFTFSSSLYAAPDISESTLTIIQGPEEFCSEGTLQVVGGDTLMVGPAITFSLLEKNEESSAADDNCRESVNRKNSDLKLVQVTKIFKCTEKYKKLENETYEELNYLPGQISYIHKRGNKTTSCLFSRKKK